MDSRRWWDIEAMGLGLMNVLEPAIIERYPLILGLTLWLLVVGMAWMVLAWSDV